MKIKTHDIRTRSLGDGLFSAECRTHAVGTPVMAYRPFDMWIKAHQSVKCACGHVAGSHGAIPTWTYYHANTHTTSPGYDGTACSTCKCDRFR